MAVYGDKSAQTGDLQVVENFVGNVMGVFREFAEHLCYCGTLASIRHISPSSSLTCTRPQDRSLKPYAAPPGACKSHICTDLRG